MLQDDTREVLRPHFNSTYVCALLVRGNHDINFFCKDIRLLYQGLENVKVRFLVHPKACHSTNGYKDGAQPLFIK